MRIHRPLCSLSLFALVAVLSLSLFPERVAADSGRFHLHLDFGAGASVVGETNRRAPHSNDRPLALLGFLGADYQLARPFAIELQFGFGGVTKPFPLSRTEGTRFFQLALGARFRFFDENTGYNNEPNGDLAGNLWMSAHVGYANYDASQFAVDFGVGYQISVARPLSLGVFARAILMFGGRRSSSDMIIVAGLSASIEVIGSSVGRDSDGDGIPDERELELGLDPEDEDTDGDLIPDGIELDTGTDPKERDTDMDGLNDGREDLNRDGVVDAGESDPRRADTDGGGMPDMDEVRSATQDPQYAGDDDLDEDGVPNHIDDCPSTPRGTEVNGAGCELVPETFTLEGVEFASGSARILPESEPVLFEALETLRQIEGQRFLIAGHTDSQGRDAANLRLSEDRANAVLRWLLEHGEDRGRFETRGFGATEPIDTNETPEGRARNRRIEFRRL